jgi:hypothetical protein
MSTPPRRTPLRPARGPFENLLAATADLAEGELVYAEDQQALYVLVDPAATGGSSGMRRELMPVLNQGFVPPMPTRVTVVGDLSLAGLAPADPLDGDMAVATTTAEGAVFASDWGALAGTPVAGGDVLMFLAPSWVKIGNLAPEAGGGGGTGGGIESLSALPPLLQGGAAARPVLSLPNATQSAAGAMSAADKVRLDSLNPAAQPQVQSDWAESSNAQVSFIRNKPGLATQAVAGFMSAPDKTKLDGLSPDAKPQVQTDWLVNDPASVSFIRNRPGPATRDVLGFVRPDGATLAVDAQGVLRVALGALNLRGVVDVTQAPPAPAAARNDAFQATAAGTCGAGWTGLAGVSVVRSALLVFDGSSWRTADVATGGTAGVQVEAGGALSRRDLGGGAIELGVRNATNALTGVLRLATAGEAAGGVLNDVGVTPLQLAQAIGGATGGGITSLTSGPGISVTGTGNARTIAGAYAGANGVSISGETISGSYSGSNGVTVEGANIRGSYRAGGSGLLSVNADVIDVLARSDNTPSRLVSRDASGNFAAGTITATLNGAATSAQSATLAAAATKLATARTINGVAFDGTQDIVVTAQSTPQTLTAGAFLSGGSFNGTAPATFAVQATAANTPSQIVARDSAGNFAAGTITAALNGRASTAGRADSAAAADTAGLATRATTADRLTTPRTINGTSFDGSADITLPATPGAPLTPQGFLQGPVYTGASAANWSVRESSSNVVQTLVSRDAAGNFAGGTITAVQFAGPLTGNVIGNLSGNATSATRLQTPRAINGVLFDGTQDITIPSTGMKLYAAATFTVRAVNGTPSLESLEKNGLISAITTTGTGSAIAVLLDFSSAVPADGVAVATLNTRSTRNDEVYTWNPARTRLTINNLGYGTTGSTYDRMSFMIVAP